MNGSPTFLVIIGPTALTSFFPPPCQVARDLLRRLPSDVPPRMQYSLPGFTFNYMRAPPANDILLCLARDTSGRSAPFEFLEMLQSSFTTTAEWVVW